MSNFNSKEDYFKFIAAWKAAVNHTNNVKHRTVCDHQLCQWNRRFTAEEKVVFEGRGYTGVTDYCYTIPNGAHERSSAWLTGAHHVLRNVLLGKQPHRGFSPVTAKRKLEDGQDPWCGYLTAMKLAMWYVDCAQKFIEDNSKEKCDRWIESGHISLISGKRERTKEDYHERLNRTLEYTLDFLLPFGDSITIKQLSEIDKKLFDSNYYDKAA